MEANTKRVGRPSKSSGSKVTSTNKTLVRSMQILERLAESKQGLSLSELSHQLGIATATTFRLLYTFEELGYVTQNKELGVWKIGIKSFKVGNAFINRRDAVIMARPLMTELREFSGETVNLSMMDEGHVVFISQVESDEMMRMIVKLGSNAPIHASGAGKAFLATMTNQQISRILKQRGLKRITPNTIDTTEKLTQELLITRSRGYAVDDEEHAVGLRCVAAAIYDETATASMAISISGPKVRISDLRLARLGNAVLETANNITTISGGELPSG